MTDHISLGAYGVLLNLTYLQSKTFHNLTIKDCGEAASRPAQPPAHLSPPHNTSAHGAAQPASSHSPSTGRGAVSHVTLINNGHWEL